MIYISSRLAYKVKSISCLLKTFKSLVLRLNFYAENIIYFTIDMQSGNSVSIDRVDSSFKTNKIIDSQEDSSIKSKAEGLHSRTSMYKVLKLSNPKLYLNLIVLK